MADRYRLVSSNPANKGESLRPIQTRVALGFLTLSSASIGAWAVLAPRSFYDGFPGFGSVWVAVDGPYNEHLIRDVGALNLALTVLLLGAAWTLSRDLVIIAAVASAVWGAPHLIYHAFNTDGLGSKDAVLSLSGLAVFLLLSIWILVDQLKTTPA